MVCGNEAMESDVLVPVSDDNEETIGPDGMLVEC